MNLADLQLLADFGVWATNIILSTCDEVSREQFYAPSTFPSGSLRGTLAHALGGEILWLRRCQGVSGPFPNAVEFPDLPTIRTRWAAQHAAMQQYLGALDDAGVNRSVHYATTTGRPYANVVWHLLMHLSHHGMQHRAECAQMLTDYGKSPGDLDMIVYLRQRA